MKPATFAPFLLALVLLACGGGGGTPANPTPPGPVPASQLVYVDPAPSSGWRLVQSPKSAPGRLVLDLVAPVGTTSRGVTLILNTDASRASWTAPEPTEGALVANRVFDGALLQRASTTTGDLRLVMSQKAGQPKACGGAAVLSVALGLGTGVTPGPITFGASQGGHLPGSAGTPAAIEIQAGTLSAR